MHSVTGRHAAKTSWNVVMIDFHKHWHPVAGTKLQSGRKAWEKLREIVTRITLYFLYGDILDSYHFDLFILLRQFIGVLVFFIFTNWQHACFFVNYLKSIHKLIQSGFQLQKHLIRQTK